jgi:hypothetical protein
MHLIVSVHLVFLQKKSCFLKTLFPDLHAQANYTRVVFCVRNTSDQAPWLKILVRKGFVRKASHQGAICSFSRHLNSKTNLANDEGI